MLQEANHCTVSSVCDLCVTTCGSCHQLVQLHTCAELELLKTPAISSALLGHTVHW